MDYRLYHHERYGLSAIAKQSTRRPAFTLIELLVVIAILGILGTLTIGALRTASGRGKSDTTRNVVEMLSNVVLEHYETYEDLAMSKARTAADVVALRKQLREEMPDSWSDVAPGANVAVPTTGAGRAYRAYKASNGHSPAYAGAECLYMIVTQSGMFPDFLANIPNKFVGDIDKDGAFEFWDGWGRPISFIRWAPGAMPASRQDPDKYHDPLDPYHADATAFALLPLIFSAGKDESENDPNAAGPSGYGRVSRALEGWPDAALQVSGTTPCNFNSDGKGLIGAIDSENPNAWRDNVSNYDGLFQ
jgi:prepilin-type N-terminal cleavage/methylation domain-containing protein